MSKRKSPGSRLPPWEKEFIRKAGDALPLLKQVRDVAEADSALQRDLTRKEALARLGLVRRLLDETNPEALYDAVMDAPARCRWRPPPRR